MAIISEQAYIANGTQREFQVVGTILSDSHIGVWIVDYSTIPVTETRLPTAHYDVLGSTVLLDVPPQSGLAVSLVLTDNGEGIEIPPSEITDISVNINKIINVSDNIEHIITNSDNMQSIIDTANIKDEVVDVADIKTQVVSIFNDKITLDSIFNYKAKLDSIFTDKATLDSIFADKLTLDTLYSMKEKLDSLYSDKDTLDSLYADKTELDSIYANLNSILSIHQNIDDVNYFADRYLGDRNIEPTTRLDGSPLLEGDLYFDKTIKLMKVYSNEGWKVAYASIDSYTKAEITNLFVGVSGNQTVDDIKTFNLPIVGSITGNSGSATKLETARKINGVDFDGTADINVLPARLAAASQIITDWNLAVENGWYQGNMALNAPNTEWNLGIVEAHGYGWVTQTVHTFTSDSPSNSAAWRRDQNGSIWGNWYRLQLNQEEQDARYVNIFGNQSISGVKTFSSSPIVPTPTTGTQAVNKEYVDNGAGVPFVANDARVKTALNATGDAPVYACRAWVNFNGTETVAIRASGNVSSIVDHGIGRYTVNFTASMPDANYSVVSNASRDTPTTPAISGIGVNSDMAHYGVLIRAINDGGGFVDSGTLTVAIIR